LRVIHPKGFSLNQVKGLSLEIVAPAGNPSSLKAASDSGAHAVYAGFSDATNARNFEGLNFTEEELSEGLEYLRSRGKKLYIAVNTFPQGSDASRWRRSVDRAASIGADALILADLGVLDYARGKYPDINIHLSVQAGSSNHESINFFRRHFDIKRVILPRVLTVEEIKRIKEKTGLEIEVFVLGGLCINAEGRCYLSSFLTGASTNTGGACSPSRFVGFSNSPDGALRITLNGFLLNELRKDERSPYPTCCKARYLLPDGRAFYAMEEPESLNAISLLAELVKAGVGALKIEGRQRTKKYVSDMTGVLSEALDRVLQDSFEVKKEWTEKTAASFEGSKETVGCYLTKG
jgi:putative protease